MFENIISGLTQGIEAADATRRLVFSDKELFLYPVFIVVAVLIEALIILGVVLFSGNYSTAAFILGIILLYFLIAFTSTYFLVAMLINFGSFIANKRIGIKESFKRANQYLLLIFEWAIFYFIIMLILMVIEAVIRSVLGRFLGGIIDALIGLAFSIMTLFSIPIIVQDQVGPVEATKRSIKFIKDHFAQTFAGFVYNEIIHLVLVVLGVLCLVAAFVVAGSHAGLAIVLVVIGIIMIVIGRLLYYVLFNCFKLIIYNYYTGKRTLPEGFTKQLIEGSVKNKSGQSGSGSNSGSSGSGGILDPSKNPFMPGN